LKDKLLFIPLWFLRNVAFRLSCETLIIILRNFYVGKTGCYIASILPTVISKEQGGFVKGRNIRDCIALTSEAINVLDKKTFGGNIAFKIDISKAFDTLNWDFLLKVLQTFGFNVIFCNWIKSISHSAKMSVFLNGAHHGFFSCNRGVRQGDPLSPLLFCIVKEVLSRSINSLVVQGRLDLISASKVSLIPSHCFYADDLMVFCKAKFSNLEGSKEIRASSKS